MLEQIKIESIFIQIMSSLLKSDCIDTELKGNEIIEFYQSFKNQWTQGSNEIQKMYGPITDANYRSYFQRLKKNNFMVNARIKDAWDYKMKLMPLKLSLCFEVSQDYGQDKINQVVTITSNDYDIAMQGLPSQLKIPANIFLERYPEYIEVYKKALI